MKNKNFKEYNTKDIIKINRVFMMKEYDQTDDYKHHSQKQDENILISSEIKEKIQEYKNSVEYQKMLRMLYKKDHSIVVVGSSLLDLPTKSDIDLVVCNSDKKIIQDITKWSKNQLKELDIKPIIIQKLMNSSSLPLSKKKKSYMVCRISISVNIKEMRYTDHGFTNIRHNITLNVIDLIFVSFPKFPKYLFEKGSFYKILGHPNICTRSKKPIQEIKQDISKGITYLNKERVKELIMDKKVRYLMEKIVSVLMRGWKIPNCTLIANVPLSISNKILNMWLSILENKNMKNIFSNYISDVQFYILHGTKKIEISAKQVLKGELILTNKMMWVLPDKTEVPAFTWMTDWVDTKKLDTLCCVCQDDKKDWNNSNVCWRSLKCAHIMCDDCHKNAVKAHKSEYRDGSENMIISSKNFKDLCSICQKDHFISRMKF